MSKTAFSAGRLTPAIAFSLAAGVANSTSLPLSVSYDMTRKSAIKAPEFTAGGAVQMDEALLNAKLDAVEARTDTKFAQLLGEMKVIGANIVGMSTEIGELRTQVRDSDRHARAAKTTVIVAIITSAIAVVGLSFAAVSMILSAMNSTAAAYQTGFTAAKKG